MIACFRWLTGRDGEVWVWVMGEHPSDPSIEEILEKETKQKAREMAEKEVRFCKFSFNNF